MGQFDQTARPLSKMDGPAFFAWGLSRSAPGTRLSFVQWDDTRRLVIPGEPDRTNDLVAQLRDDSRPERPVWFIAEVEEEPEKGILYRLGQYEFLLGKEGWQMRESQYIKRWEKVGEDRGTLQRTREYLLKRVKQLEDPVPEAIRLAIEGTNDLQTLDRWFDAALSSSTITEFRKAMTPPP
jgi:hypothetical protein